VFFFIVLVDVVYRVDGPGLLSGHGECAFRLQSRFFGELGSGGAALAVGFCLVTRSMQLAT
jgi:hypothetical protein